MKNYCVRSIQNSSVKKHRGYNKQYTETNTKLKN